MEKSNSELKLIAGINKSSDKVETAMKISSKMTKKKNRRRRRRRERVMELEIFTDGVESSGRSVEEVDEVRDD